MKPVKQDLLIYHDWLVQQNLNSEWLFPSTSRPKRHITEKQFYKVMAHVGDLLGSNKQICICRIPCGGMQVKVI